MADAPPSLPLYEIPYLRLFPWLRLFRCVGSAADPKRLMLAVVGLLAMSAGLVVLEKMMPNALRPIEAPLSGWDALGRQGFIGLPGTIVQPYTRVILPFFAVFNAAVDFKTFFAATLAALWNIVVWSLVGGAIARIAVVDLTKGERVGLVEAGTFAIHKVIPLVGSSLVPLLGVVVVAAPIAVFGLIYRVPWSIGETTAGVLAFLPLLGGMVLTLIVVGLAAGWPLMQGSVAAQAEDGFDAMSRCYAYVYQRPWHYGFYALIALVAGSIGVVFVEIFAQLVVGLASWSLTFGGPSEQIRTLYHINNGSTPLPFPAAAHAFWLAFLALIVRGWVYSYFWTASTAIYLLLRRDVDGTPWTSIAYESRPGALADAIAGPAVVPAPHSPEVHDHGEVTEV